MKKVKIVKKAPSPARIGNIVPDTVPAATPALIEYFRMRSEQGDPFFGVLDLMSLPVEIFTTDGTTVYINRAFIELNNVSDPGLIVDDFPAPLNDLVKRGFIEEKLYEAVKMDLYLYSVKRKRKLLFVVCEFHVRNLYRGIHSKGATVSL